MKKKLGIIASMTVLAIALIIVDFQTHDYSANKPQSALELSASILKNQSEKKRPILSEASIQEAGFKNVELSERSFDGYLFDRINIQPVNAKKFDLKTEGRLAVQIYMVENVKNYGIILTESYNQQTNDWKIIELSKDTFELQTASEEQKYLVTQSKDSIMALAYDKSFESYTKKLLTILGYSIP
jgi:hypothetical protein